MKQQRKTSFGELQVWSAVQGEPVVEWLRFERNGRSHRHERWEHVRVVAGAGVIVVGDARVQVEPGAAVDIPPGIDHWMETETEMELVLMYGSELSE